MTSSNRLPKLEKPVDAPSLTRWHEALLFRRAYPPDRAVWHRTGQMLSGLSKRVQALREAGADLEEMEEPEVSGMAGTGLSAVFSYGVARDLAERHGRSIDIDWEYYEKSHHLGRALPRFLPLLEEDSMVEAIVPYRQWLRAAAGKKQTLAWLMDRLARLPFSEAAEIYDSLELMLRWELRNSRATRTRTRLPARHVFCHDGPLLARKDTVLERDLESPPLPVEKLSRKEGVRILELMRDTSAVRYRELHGFTFGDPARVLRASAGRGTDIYVTVIPPEHRLPLRAYHGGMFFKNGVPVGYVEGLSLFERMEVGFNLYYTFREGETAWLYARTLRLFRQLVGVECYSVDPYQIGHKNSEAIDSGAFWFYRKLGFRPVLPMQAELCEKEERRIKNRPGYRTPPRTLRKLAESALIYECCGRNPGDWDRFEARNIGLRVQQEMARKHAGDPDALRQAALARVSSVLGTDVEAAASLAIALHLAPDLEAWSPEEKALAARILQAKSGSDEGRYLRLMQRHARMRTLLLRLGQKRGR